MEIYGAGESVGALDFDDSFSYGRLASCTPDEQVFKSVAMEQYIYIESREVFTSKIRKRTKNGFTSLDVMATLFVIG